MNFLIAKVTIYSAIQKAAAQGAAEIWECLSLMWEAQYSGRKSVLPSTALLLVKDNSHYLTGGHLAGIKIRSCELYMELVLKL